MIGGVLTLPCEGGALVFSFQNAVTKTCKYTSP